MRLLPFVAALAAACHSHPAPTDNRSLFERLGGQPAINAVVHEFVVTLAKLKVPARETNEVIGAFNGLKPEVVGH